jgi:transcriptional regulator with XRE-family HTH domain
MIAERIKDLLQVEGLKQKELADQLGIPPNYISKYLSGVSPTSDFFFAMYKKGININWLLSGEGEMYRTPNPVQSDEIDGDGFYKVLRAMFDTFDPRYKQFLQPLMSELDRRERAKHEK